MKIVAINKQTLLSIQQIVLSLTCLLLLTSGFSQEEASFNFEVNYGINISDAYQHVNGANFGKRISPILIGARITKSISNKAQMNVELEYSYKGAGGSVTDYLVVSPMYVLNLFNMNFRVEAGPYFGYLFKYNLNGMESNHDELKKVDFGTQVGIGKRIIIEDRVFYLSSQYELGLYEFSFSKHKVLQFKIGYKF